MEKQIKYYKKEFTNEKGVVETIEYLKTYPFGATDPETRENIELGKLFAKFLCRPCLENVDNFSYLYGNAMVLDPAVDDTKVEITKEEYEEAVEKFVSEIRDFALRNDFGG